MVSERTVFGWKMYLKNWTESGDKNLNGYEFLRKEFLEWSQLFTIFSSTIWLDKVVYIN